MLLPIPPVMRIKSAAKSKLENQLRTKMLRIMCVCVYNRAGCAGCCMLRMVCHAQCVVGLCVCARMVFCVLCVVLNAVYALCSVLYAVYGVVRSA